MRYVVVKDNSFRLILEDSLMTSFLVICRSKYFNKLNLVDQLFIDEYIKIKVNKNIKSLMQILIEEDEEDGTGKVLDGFEKLREMLLNKYKEHLSKEELLKLLRKIDLITNELTYNSFVEFDNMIEQENVLVEEESMEKSIRL